MGGDLSAFRNVEVRYQPNLGSHLRQRAEYRIKVKKKLRRENFNNSTLEAPNRKENEYGEEIEIRTINMKDGIRIDEMYEK